MKKEIDCLIIGHNNMDFEEYEQSVRKMGTQSIAYRDLNLNFIQFKNKPYHLSGIYNLFYAGTPEAPTGIKLLSMFDSFSATISYLGSYLQRRGYSFDYVQSFQDEKEALAKKLTADNIQTIAITTTYYVTALPILEIIEFIKQHNTTAKIIVGGPFITTKIRNLIDPSLVEYLFKNTIGADFYVNSAQGETALVNIIEAIKNNKEFAEIPNIYYKNGDTYTATHQEKENNRLAENMVNWQIFDDGIDEYADLRASISCPFSCAFCGFPQHAGKYQTATVEGLEGELNQLKQIESLRGVKFIDDTLNVPVKRFKEIMRMMIRNKYPFKWNSNFRCQYADREMVELMKESGCEMVFLGIESGSDQILTNMNKSARVEEYREGIRLLKECGITTFASFIIGFPGETEQTARETIQFIKETGLDYFRAAVWFCEHITPIWQQREKYGITGESFEWSHNTMNARQAADIVDEIYLTIDNPQWVPLFNFDIDSLWHLNHRGHPMENIKQLIGAFNRGVREKINDPNRREVSPEILRQLKTCCKMAPTHPGVVGPTEQDPSALLEAMDQSEQQDEFSVDFDLD
jgi:anaerobic magnesium-protoporphyrin IX monomethyl ester cyclase